MGSQAAVRTIAPLLLALVLSGCASYGGYGLRPGVSDENAVRQTMGRPAMELRNRDGSRELVYPRGPLGTQTFFAHLDTHGVLTGIEQVLDDDHFSAIHEGQTREQVLHRIGPPGTTTEFGNGRVAWEYRFVDTWGYLSEFSATFDRNGIVLSKIAIRFDRDNDTER